MNDELRQPGLNSLSKSFEPAALEAYWGPEWERRNYAHAGYRGSGKARTEAPAFAIHTGECLECTPMPLDGARGRQRAGAGSARRPKATDGPEGVRTLRVAPEGDKPSALYCVRGRPPLRGARHGTHPNALPTDQLHWRASVVSPMCGTTEKGGVGRDTQKNTQSTRTPPLKDKPP